MRAVDIIRKKRDGRPLGPAEIEAFVAGVTSGAWPDYQASALLMAIVLRGMDAEETACLTRAMVHSGVRLDLSDLPGVKVDKHSTGGVGCALIGQTDEIAPADRKLYALRDVTGTVESIPLITASIMSKKIAEGIGALVMDVKCGRGAFMKTRADARRLAESLVATGAANGVRTAALVTAMDVPLGRAVGNALEVIESLETLKGRGPADLEALSVTLAARMLLLAGAAASPAEAEAKVREALTSGRGLEKFREVIARQGGDPRVVEDYRLLPSAPERALVRARRGGYLVHLDAEAVGRATMLLGAGRDRVEDAIDPGVGALVLVPRGGRVSAGKALVEVHYRDAARLGPALALIEEACVIGDAPPHAAPQILETID